MKRTDTEKKTKNSFKKWILFILNPRFLLCFGLAWLVTNGWAYILLGIGTYYEIAWMATVAGAYLAFLWLPLSPEKVVTTAIAILLLRLLFPKDEKTLAVLAEMLEKAKRARKKKKDKNTDKE